MSSAVSAGFGRRFAAFLYDALLVLALLVLYTVVALIFTHGHAITASESGPGWYLYCAGELALTAAYSVLNWMRSGQTLGMRSWRIHVVSAAGRPLGWQAAMLRFACAVLAWAPLALGVLWLYLDPQRLAIQDRLSRTRVVRLAPEILPLASR